MLWRALGELAVIDDDGAVTTVSAGRQRALLAILVCNANTVVTRSALVSGLWGEAEMANPEAALQVVMSRLRRQLGPHAARIVSGHGGYVLDAAPEEVDILLAESLLRDGRSALALGEPNIAASAFVRALALWTGEALHDLIDYPFHAGAAGRLANLRIALLEARNDAYLSCDRHLEVLEDADAWTAAEPLREHLRAQQVVALYRSGRQAEALRACADLRKVLHDDLGLAPSPAMQELERRVLDQDSTLGASNAGLLTPLPEWTAQTLPFVGRTAELSRVVDVVAEVMAGTMRLVLVTGEPGIGKSRFLLQVARQTARDAIVLPVHVNHLWESSLHALARAVAEATLALSDEDLRLIVRDLPEIPNDVSVLRSVARSLTSGEEIDDFLSDAVMLNGAARWIAALSAKAPVVIVVDDFDTAGTALNHVVANLATFTMPTRVLVVAGARGPLEHTAPQVAQLVVATTEAGYAESIELDALTPDDVDALLARMRVAPRELLVDRLVALTGGHPMLLAEILGGGPVERVVDAWPSRPRVADVVRRRTADLGQATAGVLRSAALFESDFSIDLLAEVIGATEATVARLVDSAVDAHVLQPATATTYRFAHRLYRQTLIGDLGDAKRSEGHRRIAVALERRGTAPAAVLAAHWAGAAGEDAVQKVACYSRVAARDAMRLSEPHSAVFWLDLASDHIEDGERGAFLVECAEAQQLAGDPRGAESLRSAVRIALDRHDDALALRIASAHLPMWSTLPGVAGGETRELLTWVLSIATDDSTRGRVTAWLATDIALGDPVEGVAMMERAIAIARAAGDTELLSDCLMRYVGIAGSPHSLSARRAATIELLDIVSPIDVTTRFFAWSTLAVTAVQAANRDEAEHAMTEADEISRRYDLGPVRWSRLVRNAWRAALAGDGERARQQIMEAAEMGAASGIPAARDAAAIQLALLDWQECRLGVRAGQIRAYSARALDSVPGLGLVLARALADHEDGLDEARSIVAEFARDDFARLPVGPFWSSVLVLTAETAAIGRMQAASAAIRDLLMPFRNQVAHPGMWAVAPIAYGVGVACLGADDPEASAYLDQAVDVANALGAPGFADRARAATALVSR